MITQAEFNNVLVEINKILQGIDERVKKLEQNQTKPRAIPKKTS